MKHSTIFALGMVLGLLSVVGCGTAATPADESSSQTVDRYGSLEELRDAAIEAGYVCEDWVADNRVTLAAESGTCDDSSVLSTYASDSDLQQQLDQEKELTETLLDSGISTTPKLIGENWIIKAPEAADLRAALGGTLVGAKNPR